MALQGEQYNNIFQRVLVAQASHYKFLNATSKNLSFYLFGKDVPLLKNSWTFPQIDLVQVLDTYTPKAFNPLSYFVKAFIDEIANSDFIVNVSPYPMKAREPYEAFANQMEDYLEEVHRKAARKRYLRTMIFEILSHGYFGIYTNGTKYWHLSAYDVFPGDPLIRGWTNQPFIVRKTSIPKITLQRMKPNLNLNAETMAGFELLPDMDQITLYDTWIKSMDLNVCFTSAGQVFYQQPFPFPKKYPFFGESDGEMLNSFYTEPIINNLRVLLTKHQDSLENIEESGKSIGNPILTYDADAGIDVNLLQRALKEGYKRIIVGKNREGSLDFHAPGALPNYALEFPNTVLKEMMYNLGITETFLGIPKAGIRERGALGRLIKTAFRRLGAIAALVEGTYTDLDNYLLDYAQAHRMKVQETSKIKNIEEIFNPEVQYIAKERFKGFASEDTIEAKNIAMLKWKSKLIPQEEALRELGHNQPKTLMETQKQEAKNTQDLAIELKQKISELPESLLDQVSNRLKGRLNYRFYVMPVADDKVLVRCQIDEERLVGFLLSDLSDKVLVEPIKMKLAPTADQQTEEVIKDYPEYKKETPEGPGAEEKPVVPEKTEPRPGEPPAVETRGRPRKLPVPPGEEVKETLKEMTKGETKPKEERSSSPPFSEDRLKNLIARGHQIKSPEKFYDLPGLYLVEPHAKKIASGEKTIFLKSKKFADQLVDKPHLLCGDFVYGVIVVRDILEDFDIGKTEKFHLVTPERRSKWWGGKKLYLYMFEFHPFPEPLEYEFPQGVQTFIKDVKVKAKDMGLPAQGDLKAISLRPWKIPPPHKPEKKAFQPQEVFSIERLKEIIPEGTYDVSEKIDGLRCFAWMVDKKAKMFSDEGTRFADPRVKPLLEDLVKTFKHNVLLDGELVMTGIRRKDVSGYIHGKWKPTTEQLASLKYIVWDVLYVKDDSIASKPFSIRSAVLDLYLKSSCKGQICRVAHTVAKRVGVPAAAKRLKTVEGSVIRDISAAYWATHSTYKMKYMFDVDARVFAIAKTKGDLPIFYCELRDGTYIGSSYAQSEVKAKVGDVIRMNVDHVSILPDGRINWYGPKPKSWKEGKITPKRISTTQVGIGGPDRIDLVKEIYLTTGGTIEKWDEWLPKHVTWKKEKQDAFKARIKQKIKEGVEPSKI